MFTVRSEKGEVVAICSRLQDAQSYLSTNLDKTTYKIEKMTPKEVDSNNR